MQELNEDLEGYALAPNSNQEIFLSGGRRSNGEMSNKVFCLDLFAESWNGKRTSYLNHGRHLHSSITLGLKIFVICGSKTDEDGTPEYLDSVEMLDMDTVNLDSSDDNEKLWTMLTFAEEEGLYSVVLPVVCKLSDNSLIVMGGTTIDDGS